MGETTQEELRMLRARAYGPGADIHDDPGAVARLEELERLSRVETPAAAPAAPTAADSTHTSITRSTEAGATSQNVPAAASEPVPTSEPSPAPARQPLSPRARVVSVVAIAVAAVAIAVAALSAAVTAALDVFPIGSQANRVATLSPAEGVIWPEGFFPASEDDLAFDFYGLSLMRTNASFFGAESSVCLAAAATAELEAYDQTQGLTSQLYYGCAAGDFPATVELVIDDSAPDGLRGRFPADSALQFVVDGDRVKVFSDAE